jgi:predicted aspartyl protease
MGTFHTSCRVSHVTERARSVEIEHLLVDTGSEHTWVPAKLLEQIGVAREKKDVAFVLANGTMITRSIGFAILHVENAFTIDEVVFGEEGDLALLGARTLEGLNLTVDPRLKKLVAAGPLPAAPGERT